MAASFLALAGGCGGDDPPLVEGSDRSTDPGLEHVHGLGVSRGTLFIATHTGLWRAEAGSTTARRVGPSRQDIMGFSVLTSDRFVGSGHPDPSQADMPPNLGLIESRDGGRTWRNVSLLKDADFHVLESAGQRVYGFDGTQGRLMVSSDGGRKWEERRPPAAIFSLAVDPRDPDRILASTERGLFASQDAGETWRPRHEEVAGLLAWPSRGRLHLVAGSGAVMTSTDTGATWTTVGDLGGQPAAFVAESGELYAALHDGTVRRSADGGQTWTLRAKP